MRTTWWDIKSSSGNFVTSLTITTTTTIGVLTEALGGTCLVGGRWLLVGVGTVSIAGPIRLRFVQQRNVIRSRRFQTVSHLPPLRLGLFPRSVSPFKRNFTGHFGRNYQWNGGPLKVPPPPFHSSWISFPRLWEGCSIQQQQNIPHLAVSHTKR